MDVDTTSLDAVWWRHIPGGGDVHYMPPDPADGRWQHGPVVEGLYLADSEETAWAEWYRFLAEAGLPPNMALPRDLWEWKIEVDGVADLSTEDRLKRVKLPLPEPGRDRWAEFQAVGDRLFKEGFPGLLAPSAARPANLVLCLFRTEEKVPGATPLPPPDEQRVPPRIPRGTQT